MGNQFKFWWSCIRHAWRGCWTGANELAKRVIDRSRLLALKFWHRLRTRLKSYFCPRELALKVRRAARRKTALALYVLRVQRPKALERARRHLALVDRRLIGLRYDLQSRLARHRRIVIGATIVIAPIVSVWLAPLLQNAVGGYFNSERFPLLRGLLATTGGALVGATAIGFSVVMIAVQLNFARMPHGLFRRLSSDPRLLGAFAVTFVLAIGVSALSLVPDPSWAALALILAAWGTLLILILFLYGYWRALYLINPAVQLRLLVEGAQNDLRRWARRAERMAPLLDLPVEDGNGDPGSKHDLPRLAFYRANPLWTATARRAVAHAVSFARRYADQDDFAVSGVALNSVVVINTSYIAAKGKTFFASNPIFNIPEASDAFINDTLEHLRRLAHASTGRGDEEATRQVLATMAALVQVYLSIDYANHDTKEHA
jgi:hypothetical protein